MVVGLAGSVDGLPAAGRAWLGRWTPVCNTWLTCPVLVTQQRRRLGRCWSRPSPRSKAGNPSRTELAQAGKLGSIGLGLRQCLWSLGRPSLQPCKQSLRSSRRCPGTCSCSCRTGTRTRELCCRTSRRSNASTRGCKCGSLSRLLRGMCWKARRWGV